MATKDWKQTKFSTKWQRWENNKNRDEVVHITLDKNKTWYFMVKDNERAFILTKDLSKEEALEFAKDYMRTH